jgi:flotillin
VILPQFVPPQEQEIQRRERELDSTVRRPAEAEKYRLEKIAEANRNRQIMEAEADAEAEILRGEAKAFAIEARAKAEAEQVSAISDFEAEPILFHFLCFIKRYAVPILLTVLFK